MKKGKVNRMPTNPEVQIRTRARYLPIDRCRINVNWRESHLASVVITRKHVNGNISFAFCLVDLLLLGVKNCLFDFNILPEKLNEWLDEMEVDFEDCEYALAHNIVFESIDFAKEWGFEPAKSFVKTGMYLLEEDSDDIPLMDVPLGQNGVPTMFVGHDENRQHEINILRKTAGAGNYTIYYMDEYGEIAGEENGEEN